MGVPGKEKEMEAQPEGTKGKKGIKNYVRWLAVGIIGVLILLTVIMAAYRKFGG